MDGRVVVIVWRIGSNETRGVISSTHSHSRAHLHVIMTAAAGGGGRNIFLLLWDRTVGAITMSCMYSIVGPVPYGVGLSSMVYQIQVIKSCSQLVPFVISYCAVCLFLLPNSGHLARSQLVYIGSRLTIKVLCI